jgi:flagellar FliJ protein
MANRAAFDTLIELAEKATDDAAKRLGTAIRTATDTEQKLSLLNEYRNDYAARLQACLAAGLSAIGYRNFQAFLGKLDSAVTGQEKFVAEAKRRIAIERAAWQACEQKRMSYNTLSNRARQELLVREAKQDQKQTDERAARQLAHRR